MLTLLGAEKMMHTLPTVWPQGVWGTRRHGPWLTYKGQVSRQKRDGVEVREAHHERRTLPGWTKTGEQQGSRKNGLRIRTESRIPPAKDVLPVTMKYARAHLQQQVGPRGLQRICCFFTMRLHLLYLST